MQILMTGGSGMIGMALGRSLLADGHSVWVLTRNPDAVHLPEGTRAIGWDGHTKTGWGEIINQVDAVINLRGERLSNWPWTKRQKRRFWESRVDGGRAVMEAICAAATPPQVLIQASGSNCYGPHDLVPITEEEPAGNDYLAELCKAWEASTQQVEKLGVRRAIIRSGIVLSAKDGILALMLLPVRLFLGGPLGSGLQGIPWIHIKDEVDAIRFLLENKNARGPYNLTSPVPISNADFMHALARKMQRPYWLRVPAFALRLVLGEMSTLILDGAYLLPARLQELGFQFQFSNLEAALADLFTG
jgi:uncharacterized protein (TIGR01777 family)